MSSSRDFASPFASARTLLRQFGTAQDPAMPGPVFDEEPVAPGASPVSSVGTSLRGTIPVAGGGFVSDRVGITGVGGGLSGRLSQSTNSDQGFSLIDGSTATDEDGVGDDGVYGSRAPQRSSVLGAGYGAARVNADGGVGASDGIAQGRGADGLSAFGARAGSNMAGDGGLGEEGFNGSREPQRSSLFGGGYGARASADGGMIGEGNSRFQGSRAEGSVTSGAQARMTATGDGSFGDIDAQGSRAPQRSSFLGGGYGARSDSMMSRDGGDRAGAMATNHGENGVAGSRAPQRNYLSAAAERDRAAALAPMPGAERRRMDDLGPRAGSSVSFDDEGGPRGLRTQQRVSLASTRVETVSEKGFDFAANRRAFGAANDIAPSTGSSLGSGTTFSGSGNTTPPKTASVLSRLPSLFGGSAPGATSGQGIGAVISSAPFLSAPGVFGGFRKASTSPTAASSKPSDVMDAERISGKNSVADEDLLERNGGNDTRVEVKQAGIENSASRTKLCLIKLGERNGYCRGVIGTSGRICIVSRDLCGKARHRAANSFLSELHNQGVDQALFIQAPSAKLVSTSAFSSPYIDASLFNEAQLEELLSQEKTVSEWTALIPIITEIAVPEAAGKGGDPENFEERAMVANTPAKRLQVKAEKDFSASDMLFNELPAPASPRFGATVSKNLEGIINVVNFLTADVTELKNTAVDHLNAFNCLVDRLNSLQTSVGQQPKNASIPSLWLAVSELSNEQNSRFISVEQQHQQQVIDLTALQHDFVSLSNQVRQSHTGAVSRSDLQAFEVDLANTLKGVAPFVESKIRESERRTAIAMDGMFQGPVEALLLRTQDFFQNDLPQLQALLSSANNGGSSGLGATAFGLPAASGLDDLRSAIDRISVTQAEQGVRMREVEARTEDRIVTIDGTKFASLQAVQAFCTTHKCSKNIFRFVCSISLLEMVTAMAQTYQSSIDDEHKGGRVGMAKPSDQKGHFALKLSGPTALVGKPEIARENPRKLNGLESYEAFFGSGSSDTGARNTLMNLLNDKLPSYSNEIQYSEMSDTAKMIARALLMNSKIFIESSFQFMITQMMEYGASTSLSQARWWDLCQAMMRILWGLVAACLKPVSEIPIAQATTEERAPEILWALLQANRVQQEIMKDGFKGHPAVAPLLTRFLLNIVAFQDDVIKLRVDVAKSLKESNEAKRIADKAGIDARKAISTGGAKKQKKDDKD
jgi:hypothetical protein